MIFLDTSAIYALADKADPNHRVAYKRFDKALRAGEQFVVHNYILVESIALIQARLGVEAALLFFQDSSAFQIEWVDSSFHEEARREFEKIGKRGVSFIDCASFILMKQRGLKTALAFDPDFKEQGFVLYS